MPTADLSLLYLLRVNGHDNSISSVDEVWVWAPHEQRCLCMRLVFVFLVGLALSVCMCRNPQRPPITVVRAEPVLVKEVDKV